MSMFNNKRTNNNQTQIKPVRQYHRTTMPSQSESPKGQQTMAQDELLIRII